MKTGTCTIFLDMKTCTCTIYLDMKTGTYTCTCTNFLDFKTGTIVLVLFSRYENWILNLYLYYFIDVKTGSCTIL